MSLLQTYNNDEGVFSDSALKDAKAMFLKTQKALYAHIQEDWPMIDRVNKGKFTNEKNVDKMIGVTILENWKEEAKSYTSAKNYFEEKYPKTSKQRLDGTLGLDDKGKEEAVDIGAALRSFGMSQSRGSASSSNSVRSPEAQERLRNSVQKKG